ncbi:MAG: hypothetical protein JKX98_06445 [Alcanivoracaceae bacterium]|nr:hypothetical protein [Alcanivoracaceae bacterium]
MKRRNFTQTVLIAMGAVSVPMGIAFAVKSPVIALQFIDKVITNDGLILKLNKRVNPTRNQDSKQFILTYDVKNNSAPLEEKIYELKIANDEIHQVYMTPVNDSQLQAVFNWRLNA